jgi:Trm5-related predicted tRNA methylase
MLIIIEKKDDALIIQIESTSKDEIRDAIKCLSLYVWDNSFNITYTNGQIKATVFDNPNGWHTFDEIERRIKETLI